MRTQMKIMRIADILIDKEVYPRLNVDWVNVSRYANAMKAGEKFPPVRVGLFEGKYYLIDGAHRIQATKNLKQDHIQVEVEPCQSKQEIYLKAIDANINHGKQFSTQEVTNIIITLEKWNVAQEKISQIVHIPADKLTAFVAKRAVLITGADNTVSQVGLRASLRHLSGSTQDVSFQEMQNDLSPSRGQLNLVNSVIELIENGWIDSENKQVLNALANLNVMLDAYLKRNKIEVKAK